MTNQYNAFCLKAELLVRNFFKVYLEDRNFQEAIKMLHPNITWFGTGIQELCLNYADAIALMKKEAESEETKFHILEQWYETLPMGDGKCLVLGELNLEENSSNAILVNINTRFSMICMEEGSDIKLFHSHFSIPDASQATDEFFHKKLVNGYNQQLERKLEERTKLLKERTEELENITNNICGGVEICLADSGFPVLYISEGFTKLTGYTKDEMTQVLGGKHINMVHPEDWDILLNEVGKQIEEKGSFSVEYRILRKDGSIIWVMDNGTLTKRDNIEETHCILTDITLRKKQEEELRISEKRYEIALKTSEITMFEYNVRTKQLILYEQTASSYGVPNVIENGAETFVEKGIIEPETVPEYKEMYRKIHAGEPFANCFIKSRDKNGEVNSYELRLTNMFDEEGRPSYAIGVRNRIY